MSSAAPTSLEREIEEQRRWNLLPYCRHTKVFDQLVKNEFLPQEEQSARINQRVASFIKYVSEQIPYYRKIFTELGIGSADIKSISGLPLLPVLEKQTLREFYEGFQPAALPPGFQFGNYLKSSGTTGQPLQVPHTNNSIGMFALLKQREMRWFRMDPRGTYAAIRPAVDLPRNQNGETIGREETCTTPAWQFVGNYFATGKFIGYSDLNDVDDQVAWLLQNDPDYLIMQSAQMEHLSLGFQERARPARLKGLQAISHQLTRYMRHRIESTFGLPVQQNYGLNEVGIVASRCPESGRYHVHAGHCLVEIVDESGKPVKPGEQGRLLVTGLNNPAMPLIRYDADDLAVASEGPCPCGRTLPTFDSLTGRYRRIVSLPPETWGYWDTLLHTLGHMPSGFIKGLRRYQLHQYSDCTYELRLESITPINEELKNSIYQAWKKYGGENASALSIVVVDEISRPAGGKFQNFTSDYAPFPAPENGGNNNAQN